MGKGDNRNSRKTRELDAVTLDSLTKSAAKALNEAPDANPSLTLARTRTVDDPMTTRLLAEVARRQKTTDFDDEAIDAMLESAAEATAEMPADQTQQKDTSHPHTLRRAREPSGSAR
jgi:hypothetical protein